MSSFLCLKNYGFSGIFLYNTGISRIENLTKTCHNKVMKEMQNLAEMSREELEKNYIKLHTQLAQANQLLNFYIEQLRLSHIKKYGKSSEKNADGQLSLSDVFEDIMLFNEAETLKEPINIEPSEEKLVSGKHKKKKDLKALPVKEIIYELSQKEQVCPKCGNALHEMKEEVRVEIEVIPAKTVVNRYVTKVYACRNCEKNNEATIVKALGAPLPVIEKSVASASLIADILSRKYVEAVPFYRQEQTMKARNIPVSRNNMCNWAIKVANDYFSPLVNQMKKIMYNDHVIHCDETYVQVLDEPNRPAMRKSYIWVTTTAEYQKAHKIAIYNYTEGRSQTDARKVLEGYSGYIMCDGYAGYDAITKTGKYGESPMNVKPVACMVHIRRKFMEALKLINKSERKNTSAQIAIDKISLISRIDNKFNEMPPAERKEARLLYLKPALEDFFALVKTESEISLPKSKYGLALEYALKQKDKAMRVLEDGRLELDNNLAERTVKPFVIGRKNWLFSQSPQGANASCIIYSIVETAKLNNLIPYEYLKYLLERMPGLKLNDENLQSLMPWSKQLPTYIKNPEE